MLSIPYKYLLLVIVVIFMFSCIAEPDSNQLVLVMPGDPKSTDPAHATDVRTGQLCALLYDNLVKFDNGRNIIPALAKQWDISSDGKLYTFHLRDDVQFHNGIKIIADDVKFSFERILKPQTQSHRTWLFSNVVGATEFTEQKSESVVGFQAINDTTFSIKLTQPFTPFLGFLAMPSASIISISFENKIIGSGPWILDEWVHDGSILLKQNKLYFDNPPKLEILKIRILPEPLPRSAEFVTGYLDIMEVPESEYDLWANDPDWVPFIYPQNELNVYYIGLNCSRPPFNNKQVRQAVNYAVDVDAIIDIVKNGNATRANGPIPPGLLDKTSQNKYELNIELARQLLTEAGYPNGFETELWQSQSPDLLYVTEAIQSQLAEVGIVVKIVRNDWNMFSQAVSEGVPDMYYRSWFADYPDAENFLAPLFESEISNKRWTRYENLELDILIKHLQVESNQSKRNVLSKKANDILIEDAPWIYLWHSQSVFVVNPRLKNWQPSLMFNAEKYNEVWKE